ncbi:MAG TPA: hypothetical protein PLY35_09435 [Thermotogota bacterium]|nr:hypothetical protein [Thermotogota bacterium]
MKQLNLEKIMGKTNTLQSQLIAATKGLVKKWEKTGLLEGLKSEHEIGGMAVLLENQASQLITESSTISGTGTEQWSGVALPLVRRMFGRLSAKELVSVQPMNLPSGLVYYLDIRYGSGTQPGFSQNGSIFGGTGNLFGRTDAATGGLYGAGRFGYSLNDFMSSSLTATITSASWFDVKYQTELSASAAASELKKVTVKLGSDANLLGVRAFQPLSGSTPAAVTYFAEHTAGALSGTNVLVTFVVSASAGLTPTANWSVKYHKQNTADSRGDFEDTSASGSSVVLDIPELDIEMRSEPIIAETRKLKSTWTPELVQDLSAYHSIDAEAELTAYLSDYMSAEIDLEILDMLISGADTTEYWSARIGYAYGGSTTGFVAETTNATAYTQGSWFQTLGTKIQKISNIINQKTMRGGANFIVASPMVCTILESIPGYVADTDGTQDEFAFGVSKVGSFAGRYKVYKNPYLTSNVLLLGYRGGSFLETGAVYAPYVPMIMSPTIYDANNFTPRKMVSTRYAKKLINGAFYGKVVIAGLDMV